ncbi:MAG: M42 family metallopeptidase [Fimbriimonadaceae bacterium]
MARFQIDRDYLTRVLVDLLNTPSPTGFTDWAISFVQQELEVMGITSSITTKGTLVATVQGLQDSAPRALSAHIDTLGAMVKEIKPNGRLKLTALNGVMWPSVESEGVSIDTRSGRQFRGSIVLTNGAVHVNKDARDAVRTAENLELRVDERTSSDDETRLLGIDVGDFVAFDPRVEVSQSGFIRSRFLDDKACVACMLAAIKSLRDSGITPAQRTTFQFSNNEEVGHGGFDGIPADITELLVLDMAALGVGQMGDEYHCSICLKDSSGPYSKGLSDKVRSLADRAGIDLKPDIYPYYGSDGSVYWRSGGGAQVALIGPGVDTSHGYERTHLDALDDTAALVAEYLVED